MTWRRRHVWISIAITLLERERVHATPRCPTGQRPLY